MKNKIIKKWFTYWTSKLIRILLMAYTDIATVSHIFLLIFMKDKIVWSRYPISILGLLIVWLYRFLSFNNYLKEDKE